MISIEQNLRSVLVGIVPRRNLWDIIQKQRWYHVPVESAPRNAELSEYVGFYFFDVFEKDTRYKVSFFAKVSGVETVKRIALFPEEKEHMRADKDYIQFHLEGIDELPVPIASFGKRKIIHISTTYEKLCAAVEINDLYNESPLEDAVYLELKKRKIFAERQYYVKCAERVFCLDFGIFCNKGRIDLECDGEAYHSLPESIALDRERNNELTSYGWHILRFSGNEIAQDVDHCFTQIERTIENLGGITSADFDQN